MLDDALVREEGMANGSRDVNSKFDVEVEGSNLHTPMTASAIAYWP